MKTKMSKIFLCIALVVFAVCSVFAVGVFAADDATLVTTADELEAAMGRGGNVKLDSHITLTSTIQISAGEETVLDLNGWAVNAIESAVCAFDNYGKLTIKNSSETQGSVLAQCISNHGDLIIEGGSYEGLESAIVNYGTVTVNGGEFQGIGSYAFDNQPGSELTVNSDTTVKVVNGIYCDGAELNIASGLFQSGSESATLYLKDSTVSITGGSFEGYGACPTLYLTGSTTVNVSGGSFTSEDSIIATDSTGAPVLNFSGGTVDGMAFFSGTLATVITGGSFNFTKLYVVESASLKISGGTFTASESLSTVSAYLADGYAINAENSEVTSSGVAYIADPNGIKTYYQTLGDAIKEVNDVNNTITLIKDIEITASIKVSTEFILNLNGCKVTTSVLKAIVVSGEGATLTILDYSSNGNGSITSSASQVLVAENGAQVQIHSGTVESTADKGYTVKVYDDGTAFRMYGGTVKGYVAISGNSLYDGTAVEIYAGKIIASEIGIDNQQNGTVLVNGGYIEASKAAVYMRSGSLYIRGGELVTTYVDTEDKYSKDNYSYSKAGYYAGGETVVLENVIDSSFEGIIYVSVDVAKLTAKGGEIFATYAYGTDATELEGFVYIGGTYSADVSEYCASGFAVEDNGDGTYGITEDYTDAVFDDAKYNLTTTTSFVGNFYVKVPANGANYKINTAYKSIRNIDGTDYYVFTSAPLIDDITESIVFEIEITNANSKKMILTAEYTIDGYFAGVMSEYTKKGEQLTDTDKAEMKLIMNATQYANELYKYKNGTEVGYEKYEEILSNSTYSAYLTGLDAVMGEVSDTDYSSVKDYVIGASFQLLDGYQAVFVFYVPDANVDLTEVTVTYTSISGATVENKLGAIDSYDVDDVTYYYALASDIPVYDMCADQVISVTVGGEEVSVSYNLANYIANKEMDFAKALYAYAASSAEVMKITE